ncbi:type I restriction endonuclease subunit R [Nitrososphaera viennensis]|uniref:type I site-specific deoxyribonuclease n=2 Tax=Nitrososphaera viennensis TaxID=1034015 RepID=A0A060HLY9_9ARCH|nr:type I restriction endonuclease subunit R [Nitrososphaera viennensis]AIC16478.1 putative Type I restriction-modification system, restriction subunit R, site-specific deoxyribonuclease, HsdR family [Nitrososphaera viennensis EN76]UVS68411.1 type I restriction endonuclease subunit R [Nitrososphaera viennensis]
MTFDVKENNEEAVKSELPALEQLVRMGYQYLSQRDLNKTRKDYRQVLLYDRLEKAIRKLNPELDEDGVKDALHKIEEENFPHNLDHADTNEKIRAKLVGLSRSGGLEPITVTQNFGNGPEEKTVRFFDFDNPENNDFIVTNQFQLDGYKQPIFPDIVIFVNGFPLVIIECKAPSIPSPIEQAITKNFQKYQDRELGYDRLFFYNHFLIATCGTLARHGTIGASVNQYARWSESYPLTPEKVQKLCERTPREQEFLIAGMLDKAHLLDLLKNYVTYEVINSKKIKKIAKHQQYRAVTKAVGRLNHLKEDISDKGGVIWHTQGSGKSLTMMWFATQLMHKFGNPPIVIVTDRKQLDEQIEKTFKVCGFPDPIRAKSIRHLESLLKSAKGKTVMTTIQKFGTSSSHIHTDEKVIVLVDEAHRTQYKFNAEAMRSAMPNAVFFAFTGTPIDKRNKSTYRVFGPALDKYGFEESKADGATLKILYEERLPELFVEGGATIDQIFERVFIDLDEKAKDRLKKQYVTREKIAEAPARIKRICLDLVKHYTTHILPNGYKAMVVASSREAAVTYKKELDKLNAPPSKIIMTSQLGEKGKDGISWDQYYLTPEQREQESEKFKDPGDPTKILIVVDMLLVGYDVPIVQVLYLDKGLREHNLLQAIARVNRPYDANKTYGLIVDYCGITKELQKALAVFEEEDVKGALEPSEKELEELRLRHLEVMSYFTEIDKKDDNAIIVKFEPAAARDKFEYDFKAFSSALDAILPKKEADPFIDDFKYASKVRQLIRTYYEGAGTSLREYGKKVQQLIDDHIRATGISELLDPREITYHNFLSYVAKFKNERARTALVKNKARQVIEEFSAYNPAYYEKLRERLEKLIQEEALRRKEMANFFDLYKEILEDALNEEQERKKLGFSTPFEFAVYGELQPIKGDDEAAKQVTAAIYKQIEPETELVGWKSKSSSERLMSAAIYDVLTDNKFPEDKVDELIRKVLELAKRLL